MQAIENVVNTPVIRPLAIFDKVDIIKISKDIGTYDISIRPFEDCCTIFEPKNPTTSPNLEKIIQIEESFDFESHIKECISNIKVIKVDEDYQDLNEEVDNYF